MLLYFALLIHNIKLLELMRTLLVQYNRQGYPQSSFITVKEAPLRNELVLGDSGAETKYLGFIGYRVNSVRCM